VTVEQVGRLAEAIGGRYRALVLLATFGSLRWGELAALTRRHIDLDACTVQVVSWLTETDSGTLFTGPQIHFHDLRHTGNILTATAGASLRQLMARMGHASTRAALVYLHDTDDGQRIIAAAVSDLAGQQLGQLVLPETSPEEGSGT
jgi:integrase